METLKQKTPVEPVLTSLTPQEPAKQSVRLINFGVFMFTTGIFATLLATDKLPSGPGVLLITVLLILALGRGIKILADYNTLHWSSERQKEMYFSTLKDWKNVSEELRALKESMAKGN